MNFFSSGSIMGYAYVRICPLEPLYSIQPLLALVAQNLVPSVSISNHVSGEGGGTGDRGPETGRETPKL